MSTDPLVESLRRDVRVVYGGGLENHWPQGPGVRIPLPPLDRLPTASSLRATSSLPLAADRLRPHAGDDLFDDVETIQRHNQIDARKTHRLCSSGRLGGHVNGDSGPLPAVLTGRLLPSDDRVRDAHTREVP